MKHKLIGILFASVFVFNVFAPLLIARSQVYAAPSVTLEEEYKIWRSYKVVEACLEDDSFIATSNNEQDIADEIFKSSANTPTQDNRVGGVALGKMYLDLINLDSYQFGCRVLDDIKPALAQLGYAGIFEFYDAINVDTYKDGNEINKGKVVNALQNIVRQRGSQLALNEDPAFQYWFFNKLYRLSDARGGCDGVLRNDRGSRYESAVPGEYWYVDGSGNAKTYEYASYNQAENTNIEGIDGYMTGFLPASTPSCTQIAEMLTEARANAYAQRVKDAAGSDAAEDVNVTADGEASDATTCSEQFGFSSAWIVCGIMELISNAVDKLFDFADSLLSIDAQSYYNNDNLRTVWSYFRAIATFLLIAVGLVMVISQAIGGNG